MGLVLGLSLQFARAWTEPSVVSPGGNVGAPINTSSSDQYKTGDLEIRANDASRIRTIDVGEGSKYIEMQYNNSWGRLYTDGSNIYTNRMFWADGGFVVDGKWAVSGNNELHRSQYGDDTHYGYFEVRRADDQRGAYFGYGSPGDYAQLRLENGNDLAISGGSVGIGMNDPTRTLDVQREVQFGVDDGVITGSAADVLSGDGSNARLNADSFHTNGLGSGQIYIEGSRIDANTSITIGAGQAWRANSVKCRHWGDESYSEIRCERKNKNEESNCCWRRSGYCGNKRICGREKCRKIDSA